MVYKSCMIIPTRKFNYISFQYACFCGLLEETWKAKACQMISESCIFLPALQCKRLVWKPPRLHALHPRASLLVLAGRSPDWPPPNDAPFAEDHREAVGRAGVRGGCRGRGPRWCWAPRWPPGVGTGAGAPGVPLPQPWRGGKTKELSCSFVLPTLA